MESDVMLRSLAGLIEAEPEVVQGFLFAAVYCRCLTSGEAPRDVAEALWKAMPSTESWPGLRLALLDLLT